MLSEIRQPNPPFLYLNPLFKNTGDAPGQPPHRVVKVADFCTVYLLIICDVVSTLSSFTYILWHSVVDLYFMVH